MPAFFVEEINMVMQTVKSNLGERLKNDLLKAWRNGHGGSPEVVHLFHGEEGLVMMIPKGLLEAEIALSRKAGGSTRLIHNYLRELLHVVTMDLVELVEEFTQKRVEDVVPLIDLRAGWVTAFFRYQGSGELE
jgi:hypothetical protein